MLCISTMFYGMYVDGIFVSAQEQEIKHLKKELEDAMEKISHIKQDYSHIQKQKQKDFSNVKMLKEENEQLKEKLEDAMGEGEELFQENQKLKKELETLKQFELDRILDASMNEIFTTERQFLRESMIL